MTSLRAASAGDDRSGIPAVVADSARGRRRPSGEPPPLPRPVDLPARAALVVVVLALLSSAAMTSSRVLREVGEADDLVLELVDGPALDEVSRAVAALGTTSVIRAVAWGTLLVLLVTRRVWHLVTYLAVVVGTSLVVAGAAAAVGRPRPLGVTVSAQWVGYSFPSLPLAGLSLVLSAGLSVLVPPGALRSRLRISLLLLVAAVGLARVDLGVDHPTDAVVGVALGWAVPVVAFRLATPDDVFPIRYRSGRRAHLELDDRRRAALTQAARQQLGLTVVDVERVGLSGSAGSTPLVLTTTDPPRKLFAKLYAVNHLRADRAYKWARTVLYGRLEDEKPFSTVRRLVEYEDHMLRLLRDAGLPTPAPLGLIEITPEREYLVLMELFEGATELSGVVLTDSEIDDGLAVVRKLWLAGVAHRDLKPSNLLLRDGQVLLIDVAFAAVRPTPWRQAVDLANMMLTLALCSTPERVYARAVRVFAPEDIAEAFAASRGVTVPSQLRARMRADGRDLPQAFRRLAPSRAPVKIQLWSLRRALAALGAVAAVAGGAVVVGAYLRLAGLL